MSRIQKLLTWFENISSGFCLVVGFGLMFYEVVMRYVFDSPTTWINEVSTVLVVWSVFLGLSLGLRDHHHISADILYAILPIAAQKWMDYLSNLIGAIFCIILTYTSLVLVNNMILSARVSTVTGIPLWSYNLILPVAGFMFMIRFLEGIWKTYCSNKNNQLGGGNH